MGKRILALDLGGTSVKAAIYYQGCIEAQDVWAHDYQTCCLRDAKRHLLSGIRNLCPDLIDAIGLSVAGLIATDGSLFRSTVLGALVGFNLPDFFKNEMKVRAVTIDNDADCGAIYEWRTIQNNLFFVVVGSGIGSAWVDNDGNLPYMVRLAPDHHFSETDNPVPNDLGLRVGILPDDVLITLTNHGVSRKLAEKFLIEGDFNFLNSPDGIHLIRVGNLGSATGIRRIIALLLKADNLSPTDWLAHYKDYHNFTAQALSNDYQAAQIVCVLAKRSDAHAQKALDIFANFLAQGIIVAQQIIYQEQKLKNYSNVHLGGAIMASVHLFLPELRKTLNNHLSNCQLTIVKDPTIVNLHGAYWRAFTALEADKK